MLYLNAGRSLPVTVSAGNSLVVKVMSGAVSVSGGFQARDCSESHGAGAVAYGPVLSSTSMIISTTGDCYYGVFDGDLVPSGPVHGQFDEYGNLVALSNGYSTRPLGPIAQQHVEHTLKLYAEPSNTTTGAATFQITQTAPCDFDQVQVCFVNIGIGYNVNAVVAVSNNLTTPKVPSTGTLISVTKGGSTTIAVDAGTSSTLPAITASDWIDISSIPRTDGGTMPVIMCRVYLASGTQAYTYYNITSGQTQVANFTAEPGNPGFVNLNYYYAGDGITSPANWNASSTTNNAVFGAMFLRFRTRKRARTIASWGNSVFSGLTHTTSGWANFVWRTCRTLTANGDPWFSANFGWSGQNSSQYLARALVDLPIVKPDIAIFEPWSVNDGALNSDTALYTALQRWQKFAAAAIAVGSTPVAATKFPAPAGRYAQAATLLSAIRSSGYVVMDADAVLGAGPNSARTWANSAHTSDQTHMTDAGHEATHQYALVPAIMSAGFY